MIRSFVAIDLPESVRGALRGVSDRLRRRAPERSVRWTDVAGIHLTLKFLGDVREQDLPQIKAGLAEVGARHTPFSLTFGGVGCFPSVRKPRVVWVGIEEDTGSLAALQRDVEQTLAPLGFEPEKRPFHPHLTLGRAQRNLRSSDERRLAEVIATAGVGELGQIAVSSIQLMRSNLRPTGAVYSVLGAFPLRGSQEAE